MVSKAYLFPPVLFSEEGVSRQKNLSRSFYTRMNVLYFLSQTFTLKLNVCHWTEQLADSVQVPSITGMLSGSCISKLFFCIDSPFGDMRLLKGISDFLRENILWWSCQLFYFLDFETAYTTLDFSIPPEIYWSETNTC